MCKYLYHYTTLGVLQKIFNDTKGRTVELLFKDYHFLNDEDEGKWLVRFFEECKKDIIDKFEESEKLACGKAIKDFVEYGCFRMRLKEQNNRHYSFSMSELEDSMLFWRQDYAKENGVALCTEKTEFEKKSKLIVEPVRYLDVDTIKDVLLNFANAIREDSKYIKDRNDLRSGISDSLDGERALENTDFLRIKNGTWGLEKEWRVIIADGCKLLNKRADKKENAMLAKNKRKKSGFEIDENFIPRYRVKMKNPFSKIILGPSISDYYVNSVQEWLDCKGYKITVSKSLGHGR